MEYSLKDKTILRIAIIVSTIGLLSLFILMFFKTEKLIQIDEISKYNDQKIVIVGIAKNISHRNNNTRFLVYQECSVEVMLFSKTLNNTMEGKEVYIEGKPQEYNSKISIIADKITLKQD